MACSLRRRWKPSRRSSSGCMAADGGGRVAVLLMAYGGPGSLDEVEPYLQDVRGGRPTAPELVQEIRQRDRKSTRLNSSHSQISYAVFCLKKKKHRVQLNLSLLLASSPERVSLAH